ncbi:hydroxymethylbilane synthase [Haloplanus halophilus]|uniref:hydroxymethylbilane synthase n=1 Tax=Haloplanus halophilus TaxID=2949993 RepID=UPI00203E7C19|nr:hydroxymethylbilane synthase [Haloplanus sp. GDY1]
MSTRGTIRLATRGSDLARRQAASVSERLDGPRRTVETVEVSTRGDEIRDELIHRLGKTGAFVRALDEKVLDGDVDAAVHSMKDMPTESPEDLVVAGVPERAPAGDVLVTPDGAELEALPEGAVVGTSSLRRGAQLRRARPDLDIEPLRGNVDTRLEKLLAPSLQREHERRLEAAEADGDDAFDRSVDEWFDGLSELERSAMERAVDREYDAVVLAEAGLERSGLLGTVETTRLPRDAFVPAPGQGAIAVTARADGEMTGTIHDRIDDPVTRVETTVERTILAELGGGCIAPIGVYAVVQGEYVHVTVQVLSLDGEEGVERTADLPITDHADAAASLAAELREEGAAALVERAREEADAGTGASE